MGLGGWVASRPNAVAFKIVIEHSVNGFGERPSFVFCDGFNLFACFRPNPQLGLTLRFLLCVCHGALKITVFWYLSIPKSVIKDQKGLSI